MNRDGRRAVAALCVIIRNSNTNSACIADRVVAKREPVVEILMLNREADLPSGRVDRRARQYGSVSRRTKRISDAERRRASRVPDSAHGKRRREAIVGIVPIDRDDMSIKQADVRITTHYRGDAILRNISN